MTTLPENALIVGAHLLAQKSMTDTKKTHTHTHNTIVKPKYSLLYSESKTMPKSQGESPRMRRHTTLLQSTASLI